MSRSIWTVLGLKAGADRDTIRRAYAAKLRQTNPEDDPEGFKALRHAYETALGRTAPSPPPPPPPPPPVVPVEAVQPGEDVNPDARFETAQADDHRAFEAAKRALLAKLRGPWEGSDAELGQALAEVLAAPSMAVLSVRDATERWLALAISRNLPRADTLIAAAVAEFGWDDGDFKAKPPPVRAVLRRLDEWKFVRANASAYAPLNLGWRALYRPPRAKWLMALAALTTAPVSQVRQILAIADGRLPGIRDWFNPDAEAWWRNYFSRPRLTPLLLLLAPLMIALEMWIGIVTELPDIFFVSLLALSLASPWLWLHFVTRRAERRAKQRIRLPEWRRLGWLGALAGLTVAAACLPDNRFGAMAAVVLAMAATAWIIDSTSAVEETAPLFLWRLFRMCLAPGLFAMVLSAPLSKYRVLTLALVILAFVMGRLRGVPVLVALARRGGGFWRLALTLAGGAVLIVGAAFGIGTGFLRKTDTLYIVLLAAIAAEALVSVGWLLIPAGRARWVLNAARLAIWLSAFNAFGHVAPPRHPPPADRPAVQDIAGPSLARPAVLTTPADKILTRADLPKRIADGTYSLSVDLLLDAGGKPLECVPRNSTGLPAIDKVMCAAFIRNMHFTPARDAHGVDKRSVYAFAYHFTLSPHRMSTPDATADAKPVPHPPAACPADTRVFDHPGIAQPPKECDGEHWIGDGDYPLPAKRAHAQGRVLVMLAVSAEGRVTDCSVLTSSGSANLDATTCRLLTERARFLPALDFDGTPVAGRVRQGMTWRLLH